MPNPTPTLVWFRRDFRLSDHAALTAAVARGGPVIPVYLLEEEAEALGAAPKWRMGLAVEQFAARLGSLGSRLILRRGKAVEELEKLRAETGAGAVYWSRAYLPDQVARDKQVKARLGEAGCDARSFPGHLLFEPWTVETGSGGFYKVYTPMWKAVRDRSLDAPLPAPSDLPAPDTWPDSDRLADWQMDRAMNRGAEVVQAHIAVGEAAAQARLDHFLDKIVQDYDRTRDLPATYGTSRLSENLTHGEISPLTAWHAGQRAMAEGKSGAETFLKELVWREFAYHLAWHTPRILTDNWRPEWDDFPWTGETDAVLRWKQGRTGVPFVDAAMREMYVTGTMHNRGRMIVASYLTKHMLTHWKVGMDWFADCLVDWDPASNAMGWQWSAGSGPDATPYFRIFNPETQLEKFDKSGAYTRKFIAEMYRPPSDTARSFFEAIPRAWGLSPEMGYPKPLVDLSEGRTRALDAYQQHRKAG